MSPLNNLTKIVATIGPASQSPSVLKKMIENGMNVARLNFSHGSYKDHAKIIETLRQVSDELEIPVTLLQDLQGPKIRVGVLPEGEIELKEGGELTLIPLHEFSNQPETISIDYPYLAEEAQPGTAVLMDDGLLELTVTSVTGNAVKCHIIKGGILKSRKGVNLPSLHLRLPSLTDKDKEDLDFGISQGVDWISLSFVREASDILALKELLKSKNADIPIIAKIEKPQAVKNLESILAVSEGIMVARGDLGVEIHPAKVPMIQKNIIRQCNERGIPVITATQMLDSMIHNPRPTRAEASDVANAIADGTDAVMLSGESAMGLYPVQAIRMMAEIAQSVEQEVQFFNYPPSESDETHALSEALNAIGKTLNLRCIVALTSSGYTALLASSERPKVPIVAITPNLKVYHRLNLIWGIKPFWIEQDFQSFDQVIANISTFLLQQKLVDLGDRIVIMGGIPMGQSGGTNFIKIHTIS